MFLAIVPAYNEEKYIGSVITALKRHVDKVVVVDDGSTDQTASIARDNGTVVICHAINRGQGAALETGHAYARSVGADLVVDFDADGQFDAGDISGAVLHLQEKHADILFGSRHLLNTSNIPWTKKYLLLPMAQFFQKMFFGIYLSDAHNGFRILNRRALDSIHVTQDGMAHATEIPALAKASHLNVVEYPVKVLYFEYGQGVAGGFRIVKDLMFGTFLK